MSPRPTMPTEIVVRRPPQPPMSCADVWRLIEQRFNRIEQTLDAMTEKEHTDEF